MELQQLRYFVTVAELGNFTRAAEKCYVSQPSLSQQIIKLEKEIGHPLIERLGRRLRLTSAGEIFYERASNILRAVEETQHLVNASYTLENKKIRLGAIPTIAPFLIPPLLKKTVSSTSGCRNHFQRNDNRPDDAGLQSRGPGPGISFASTPRGTA